MDLLLELLEDPAHRHVLLNHLPITGLAVAWIVTAWAIWEARRPTIVFALALLAACSLSGWPVMETGEAAYPFVYETLDGVSRDWLDHHTTIADDWGFVLPTNGVLAVLAIAVGFWRPGWQRAAALGLLLTSLASLGVAAWIAESGGQIRHAEFRLRDPPRPERPGRLR